MATRKQKARKAKTFRHEYGFVVPDEEGNEVEITGAEVRGKPADDAKSPAKSTASASKPKRGEPQPPSWRRALKRGGLTGVGLAVLLVFLLHGPIVLALVYGVLFIPLTYWMDGLSYRWWKKRQEQAGNTGKQSGKPGSRPGARKSR